MRLVLATEEEKVRRDSLCHAEWGQRLTPAQFAAREQRLRGHAWAKERMATWLWKDRGGAVLASCETFRMDSFVRAEPGNTYGVASVYTEPALRGRGYAGQLMRALVSELQHDARAHASLLFSDVGAPLYERAGYVAVPAPDWVWTPLATDVAPEVDALFTEAELARELAGVPRPSADFVVWPSEGQLDWHLERERAYADLLGTTRPQACGARAGSARAFWMADLKNERLMVLLFAASDVAESRALLRCARAVAHACRLGEVRMYAQPAPFRSPEEVDGRTVEREGELAMLASLDVRVRADGWRYICRALWI